jgi:exonuclease SbcC
MRPRNLHIEGFTCFSDAVDIDFTPMDVFVISGPTGAGKSTIIDAMCYALYGRIPRHGETNALMSHNRDTLRVSLEFEAGGSRYRVLRSINRVRKTGRDGSERVSRTISPVQLEVFESGEWTSMEGRVARIDSEIERIIGLDFDGFQRCILLPQGRFQEFLAGDAKQRRALLVELLDIGIYERMMRVANARRKEQDDRADERTTWLETDYKDATEEALEATRAQLSQERTAHKAAQVGHDVLRKANELAAQATNAIERARQRTVELAAVRKQIADAERLGREGKDELEELRVSIATAQKKVEGIAYDAALHQRLIAAYERARQLARLRAELGQAQAAIADTTTLVHADAASAAAAIALASAEAARNEAAEHREDVQRSDLAAHLRAGLKPGDACPVCAAKVSKVAKAAPANLKAAEKALKDAETAEKHAREALTAAELAAASEHQRLDAAKQRAITAEQQVKSAAAELRAGLPKGVGDDVEVIEAAVKSQKQAEESRASAQAELDERKKHESTLAPKVAASAEEVAKLTGDAGRIDKEIVAATTEKEEAISSLKALSQEYGWTDVTELIDASQNPRRLIEQRYNDANTQVQRFTVSVTQLEGREKLISEKIEKAAILRGEIETLRQSAALHRELGRLLRADHFQEFVISEAMLILAGSATAHLELLYPRMALTVEDGEFCVIDHWQAEQKRPARTLSGGETFVASLALSLALSERLPELRNAASASLESLFLDEGFGTLDAETLETVIDALEGLRSEERLVGIITHVKELAERIDTRIEVRKSPEGSTVSVG